MNSTVSEDDAASMRHESGAADTTNPALCILGSCDIRSWTLTPAARAERLFRRAGITRVISEDALEYHRDAVIMIRADAIIDAPLVPALVARPDAILMSNFDGTSVPVAVHATPARSAAARKVIAGELPASHAEGLEPLAPKQLGAAFWHALRKRETPYALVITPANRKAAEWRMFMGTYKGATDAVTKHLWPWPAFMVTRLIAPIGITPNMVTTVGAALVVAAYFLFEAGLWWPGLAAAWLMTFLDTVDGKLARTALQSSKWGDVFDHGIDLVHPPFWYAAWAFGVQAGTHALSPAAYWWCLVIMIGGYLLQRAIEGISIKRFGLEIHIWRPIDTLFRQVTARRNPNLVLFTLGVIAGRPDLGLIAVAAWTAVCLVLHAVQLVQANTMFRRNGRLDSWMSEAA